MILLNKTLNKVIFKMIINNIYKVISKYKMMISKYKMKFSSVKLNKVKMIS